jgi:hypothetical protein
MNKPPLSPVRERLQALQAIPERDRTDEQWDEMNELEIALASENHPRDPGRALHGKDAALMGHADRGSPGGKKMAKKHHRQQRKGNAQRRPK